MCAGERRRRGKGDRRAQELSAVIGSALEETILTHLLPRSQIDIYIQVRCLDTLLGNLHRLPYSPRACRLSVLRHAPMLLELKTTCTCMCLCLCAFVCSCMCMGLWCHTGTSSGRWYTVCWHQRRCVGIGRRGSAYGGPVRRVCSRCAHKTPHTQRKTHDSTQCAARCVHVSMCVYVCVSVCVCNIYICRLPSGHALVRPELPGRLRWRS